MRRALITLCREQRLVLEPRAHARLHLIARCLIAMLFLEEGYQRGSSVLAEVADDATVPNVLADAFLLLLFVAMTALVLVGLHARWAAGAMVLVGVVDNFQSNFFLFDLAHPLAHLGELQKMLLTHQYRFFQGALDPRRPAAARRPRARRHLPRRRGRRRRRRQDRVARRRRPSSPAARRGAAADADARVAEHVDEGHRGVAEST